jgi:hypothetical protein
MTPIIGPSRTATGLPAVGQLPDLGIDDPVLLTAGRVLALENEVHQGYRLSRLCRQHFDGSIVS